MITVEQRVKEEAKRQGLSPQAIEAAAILRAQKATLPAGPQFPGIRKRCEAILGEERICSD